MVFYGELVWDSSRGVADVFIEPRADSRVHARRIARAPSPQEEEKRGKKRWWRREKDKADGGEGGRECVKQRGNERTKASTEGRERGTLRSWSDASATGAPARFVVEHVLDVVELSALAAPTGRPPRFSGYDRSAVGGERGPPAPPAISRHDTHRCLPRPSLGEYLATLWLRDDWTFRWERMDCWHWQGKFTFRVSFKRKCWNDWVWTIEGRV